MMAGEPVFAALRVEPENELTCACGHSRYWHSHGGDGDCEHDASCECASFRIEDRTGHSPC